MVNFFRSSLAFFRAFFPGLSGISIVGVLMFGLAVIKISLEGGQGQSELGGEGRVGEEQGAKKDHSNEDDDNNNNNE